MNHLFKILGAIALATALFAIDVAPAAASSDYELGSGDRLRITVFGEEDLTGEFEVGGGGSIAFPLIGTVSAGGSSVRDLEERISSRLKDGYLVNPRVSIEVLNYRPFYIMGEVNKPGEYPYRAGLTVINAVSIAGGFTFRADEDDIVIQRAEGGGAAPVGRGSVVQPGDVVRVKERFF